MVDQVDSPVSSPIEPTTPIKLSQAMRLANLTIPQVQNSLFDLDDDGNTVGACAIGLAAIGTGYVYTEEFIDAVRGLDNIYDWFVFQASKVLCDKTDYHPNDRECEGVFIKENVISWNDSGMPLEEIVQNLEKMGL